MQGVFHDSATDHDISMAAASVLDKCVFRIGARRRTNKPIGGYLGSVGSCFVFFFLFFTPVLLFLAVIPRGTYFRLTRLLLSGKNAGLAIRVSSYEPNVHCASYPGYSKEETACSKLLGTLQVATGPYVFAREKTAGKRTVIIPPGGKKIASGTHCILFLAFSCVRKSCALSVLVPR